MSGKFPLTVHGAQMLRTELQRLKTIDRPAVIAAIAEARSHGDLSENAEYDAVLNQTLQGNVDEAGRSRLYQQAEGIIERDTAVIPVYGFVNSRLVKPRIGGYSTEDVLNELPSKRLFIQ